MKVIGEKFVKLPIDESESKKNNDIQEILNGNVPEETLKR